MDESNRNSNHRRMELWCQEYHYGRGCRLTWGDLGRSGETWGDLGRPGGCAAINGGSIPTDSILGGWTSASQRWCELQGGFLRFWPRIVSETMASDQLGMVWEKSSCWILRWSLFSRQIERLMHDLVWRCVCRYFWTSLGFRFCTSIFCNARRYVCIYIYTAPACAY